MAARQALSGSNLPTMAQANALRQLRVGWWAGAEPADPLAALTGYVLRAEILARLPGLQPVLVQATPASWAEPGFTGEPVAVRLASGWDEVGEAPEARSPRPPLDILVASGHPEPGGAKMSQALSEAGTVVAAVAPDEAWGMEPALSVGPPFAIPEPLVLAARHLARSVLDARGAFLRVAEGLPKSYVLVEGSVLDDARGDISERSDLDLALLMLAEAAGTAAGTTVAAEVVELAPGPLRADDHAVDTALRRRRAEAEEGRYQPEDWPGNAERERIALRVSSPVDLAAAVAGASAVVAGSGAMMALAWAFGVPHAAVALEGGPASNFAAWTGDASALVAGPAELVAAMDGIFARRGRPPGLQRLEATLDESLDKAASDLDKAAADVAAAGPGEAQGVPLTERLHELEAVNQALRFRLAAERLRFGERATMVEQAAHTTVESAIKAVHGQDVVVRRRLEQAEKEMKRLQEETALQQAELKAIYGTLTMRALMPAREWYGRLRKAAR